MTATMSALWLCSHHSTEDADALLDRLSGHVSLSHLQGLHTFYNLKKKEKYKCETIVVIGTIILITMTINKIF